EDAHRRLRLRSLPGQERRGGNRPRPALPLLHARELAGGATGGAGPRASPLYSREVGGGDPRGAPPAAPASDAAIAAIVPADENQPFDMREVLDALLDADSLLEVHKRWAKELIVGYGRLDGRVVGVVANQPRQKGGVLFVDSADKAARFIQT